MEHGSIAESNAHASVRSIFGIVEEWTDPTQSFASASDDDDSEHINRRVRVPALEGFQRTASPAGKSDGISATRDVSAAGTMRSLADSSSKKHHAVSAWKELAQENHHGSAGDSLNRGKAPTVFTGYDSVGKAHERIRSLSTVASDDSPPESASQVAPRSNFARVKVRIICVCSAMQNMLIRSLS